MSDSNKMKMGSAATGFLFSAGGVILVFIILILVNVIVSRLNLRFDLTEEKTYSLSKGTKEILSGLENDVTIKVFYSKDNVNIPVNIKSYAKRLLAFLDEYEHYSNGKVEIEVFNTEVDTDEEEWALQYGIEGVNLPTGEKFYFGIAAVSADQEETIPMVDPTREEQLEYDITRMIWRVQHPEKATIGIISGHQIFGSGPNYFNPQNPQQQQDPWLFVTELKKIYEVREIPPTAEEIPDDIDLLILFYPKELEDKLLFAVDQYVLSGKNAVVFADAFSVSDENPGQSRSAVPEKLLSAWGVEIETNRILADFGFATRVMNQYRQPEDSPLWVSPEGEAFNADNIITSNLESMLFPTVGAIKKAKDFKYQYETLISSSTNSQVIDAFKLRMGTEQIRKDFKATPEKYDLAAKITGKFQTAFPDGKPGEEMDEKEMEDSPIAPVFIKEAEKPATVLLIADADLLYDGFYVSKQSVFGFNVARIFNDNLNFLLNSCEMLTGSQELISIRTRGKFERPFTRVQEIEDRARERWLAREQELVQQVDETNRKLRQIEQETDGNNQVIVDAQKEAEIEKFKEERRRINQKLKDVRKKRRAEIEDLGNRIKFVNIALMPILVSIAGIIYGVYRKKRNKG